MTSGLASKEDPDSTEKVPVLLSKRWILAYIGCLGFLAIYAMRVNLSVAIVCMVRDDQKNTTSSANITSNITSNSTINTEQCVVESSDSENLDSAIRDPQRGEFDWDKSTQGLILSSFFFGYLGTNLLGGWLSGIFGGRRVWGLGVFIAAVATVLLPVGARFSYKLVIALRTITGLAQGVSFPSMHNMLGRWAPLSDRTKLSSFIYSGQNVGNIVTYIVSGTLCEDGFDNGWGSIFYITGGMCFFWVAAWFLLVADSPEQHKTISKAELNYIVTGRGNISHRDIVVPWLSIAKSRALWVCLVAHVCNSWLSYTLLTGLPTFMKEVLKFDVKSNGVWSALPYIVMIVSVLPGGYLAHFIRSRYLSTTYTRRLFQSVAFLGSGACIVAVGFVDCTNKMLGVALLAVAVGFEGLCFAGYNVNQVDFAPRYAGVLMGFTNTIATIPGILAPTVIGALTPNKTQEEWRVVFYICGGMCLLGTIVFGLFASGELEPWAVVPDAKETSSDLPEKHKQDNDHHQAHVNTAFYNSNESLHKTETKGDAIWTQL